MAPETKYAEGADGLIAYQVVGDGPFDLVYLSGSISHVDVRWEAPPAVAFLHQLSSFSRLILFDRRGTGASDQVAVDALPTWEEWADDLRVVLDEVHSDRAAIFALLEAGPMAMVFAATAPERTRALVLANTTARPRAAADYPAGFPPEQLEALVSGVIEGWGTEEGAAGVNASLSADPRLRSWFAKYTRASATPRVAAAQIRSFLETDVRSVLPTISAPTLVLHRRDFAMVPVEQGRFLAENIPGAAFIELPGADASMFAADSEVILDHVEEFLTGLRRVPEPDRVLVTVLITDLVSSTTRAVELGDRAWRNVLDRHDDLMRRAVESGRGTVLKSTGDGHVAVFDSPGRAIQCALTVRESVQTQLGVLVRAGIHTGEAERRGADYGGVAMHIAARIAALAAPGELLVSRTVSDLIAGSGISLVDRGAHELRGVPGPWQLLAVK
ncbi:MAG TPA: adenylate/guanylate cyclase domain-containing protein [Mycobacteriales bacterium]|nr:adenylate/guanylate cyclase domain-containing protein [Mycobacteriales bacterium]